LIKVAQCIGLYRSSEAVPGRSLTAVFLSLVIHYTQHHAGYSESSIAVEKTEIKISENKLSGNINSYHTAETIVYTVYIATIAVHLILHLQINCMKHMQISFLLECGPMLNVMVALPNIGGALCSTPQTLADAHY